MPTIWVNGAEIYHEVRGDGPSILLIMGATGDAGPFETLADLLADEFTVLSYDRRANGRSPRPDGWLTTSVREQADDAAALLGALGSAPSAVFGTSSGGVIALCLLICHPRAVRGAVPHEPAMYSLFDDSPGVRNVMTALISEGLAAGGPPAALERFWRFVAGDANWMELGAGLRQRMLSSAETYLVERAAIGSYLPDDETLTAIEVPVDVLAGEQSQPFFQQAARRLAARLNVRVSWTLGTHTPYQDHPHELSEAIRPFLRRVSGVASSGETIE